MHHHTRVQFAYIEGTRNRIIELKRAATHPHTHTRTLACKRTHDDDGDDDDELIKFSNWQLIMYNVYVCVCVCVHAGQCELNACFRLFFVTDLHARQHRYYATQCDVFD